MRPSTIVVLLFAAAVSLSCTRDMVAPGLHEAALVADLVPLAGCPAAGDFTLATGYVPQGTPPDRNGDGFVCVKTVPAPGLCGKIGCSALVIVDNNVPLAGNGCPAGYTPTTATEAPDADVNADGTICAQQGTDGSTIFVDNVT